jgi:hypothetical protein
VEVKVDRNRVSDPGGADGDRPMWLQDENAGGAYGSEQSRPSSEGCSRQQARQRIQRLVGDLHPGDVVKVAHLGSGMFAEVLYVGPQMTVGAGGAPSEMSGRAIIGCRLQARCRGSAGGDGEHGGYRYFRCERGLGVLLQPDQVQLVPPSECPVRAALVPMNEVRRVLG